ncbi:MAG TPA: CocE/NonD family hydrolase [Actinomycetota bacterium]|nr:CocE/NonD family hydrolase [Actinomycetota bacterium]
MREDRRFLEMDDGVRIAVTLFFPDGPGPWPALLEARPYRKDDVTWSQTHDYRRLCREGGYVVCRADVRGTGSSEGVAEDEYTEREHRDWLRVIDWLATQPWSTGAVGMFGKSYSGFNAIQVAMLRPPALKAIVPIFATDRRFTDDVHYGGGARRGIDVLDYPLSMVAMNALPPVPALAGPGWRERWRERIERTEPWMLRWLEEQTESAYWRHGSLHGRYETIEAATLIVAGHADGYHNMAFRTFAALQAPKALLFGPWSHMSPDVSMPGPRIDHLRELLRWFDRWLKGVDNGVDREPPIRIFVRRPTPPEPDLESFRGTWRFEPAWPPERLREQVRPLSSSSISGRRPPRDALEIRGDVGVTGSIWCADDLPFGTPWDQRADEAFSLVYEWPPLDDELEIMGHPRVDVSLSADVPVAYLSAKLCDAFPDGTSALVTRGILNLTHRDSHERPTPLEPGRTHQVTIELDATAYVFEPGHRIRLDLAAADFPSSWPPPLPGTISVSREGSRLVLPVLQGPPPVTEAPTFGPGAPAPETRKATWRIEEDVLGRTRSVVIGHDAEEETEDGTRVSSLGGGHITVSTVDPGQAVAQGRYRYEVAWPEATVRTEATGTLRSDVRTYRLELELVVLEDGREIARRRWEREVPRHLQ